MRERERDKTGTRKRRKGTLTNHIKEKKLKSFQFHSKKNSKPFLVLKVLSSNPFPRLEKFCRPVMVFKLKKTILKNFFKNLAIIEDNNISRTISLSQENIRYPCFKPEIVSQAHKDPKISDIKNLKNIPLHL